MRKTEEEMKFYRYDIYRSGSLNAFDEVIYKTTIQLTKYRMVKETPKGYWIDITGWNKTYWVSKTGRKRHAYPTKEEAMNSFVIRTKRRRAILQSHLNSCNEALELVNTIEK